MARYSKQETLKLKNHILEVTEKIIRENGNAEMTMRGLAKTANVSPTTAYNIFGSKRQLLIDVLVQDFLTDVMTLQIFSSPSDSLMEMFGHIDKIESAVMPKEKFVKALITGVIQCSDEINTQHISALMQGAATGWVTQKITDKLLAKDTDITFLSQQLAASVAGHLFLWVSNSIPSNEIKKRIQYVIATHIFVHATVKQRPAIQKILKEIN
ncbi:MAG: TetR/AcrR family transcriptional regulator [Pseudomonadales bacterium]|nr:TetR/AcrR family transcriptional regulator [Pseudomonadales bacterium]